LLPYQSSLIVTHPRGALTTNVAAMVRPAVAGRLSNICPTSGREMAASTTGLPLIDGTYYLSHGAAGRPLVSVTGTLHISGRTGRAPIAVPAARHHEERLIEAQPGIGLWANATGDPDAAPLLLVMGANATGIAGPDALVTRLAEHHRVLRYDHRDTGRSTRAFAERPYPLTQLARDTLAILDGFGARPRRRVPGVRQPGYRGRGNALLSRPGAQNRPRAGRDADVRLTRDVRPLPPR